MSTNANTKSARTVTPAAAPSLPEAAATLPPVTAAATITLHGRMFNVTLLQKAIDDSRSALGRMRTGRAAGYRVTGSSKAGTLADWEGHTLRAPATPAEERAIKVDRAVAALLRALS